MSCMSDHSTLAACQWSAVLVHSNYISYCDLPSFLAALYDMLPAHITCITTLHCRQD